MWDQAGQNWLQPSPAKPLGVFGQVHAQHGAPWPPHHSHPTAGLSTVGCTPPGWGGRQGCGQTQHGGCGDSNHHEPARGGCPAVGAHHCTAAPRGRRGLPVAVGTSSGWSAVATTSSWSAVGALSCWSGGHGRAATGHVEQGGEEMRNEAPLAD